MFESVVSACPYCGEAVELSIDADGGAHQSYVEDCPVCCQPCQVEVIQKDDGEWNMTLRTSDE
jgi:hypothetical protein